ncbi:hydrophobic surface binding protein [Infundibulicybe gibba]|nr:hydrophobic surface binding protein [Infundibulicybe gibba]
MQLSTILVFASFALAGFAAPNAKRTVALIEADIAIISKQAGVLAANTSAFPNAGGSLGAALNIHEDIVNLGFAFNNGLTDIQGTPLPISESDGQTILALATQLLEPSMLNALAEIVDKGNAFQNTPPVGDIPPLILQDMQELQKSTDAFLLALAAAEPADLQAQITAIQTSLDIAFMVIIMAYTNL